MRRRADLLRAVLTAESVRAFARLSPQTDLQLHKSRVLAARLAVSPACLVSDDKQRVELFLLM